MSFSFSSFSQCKEWKWPVDKSKAQEKLALLQDAIRLKSYKQAISPLDWFLVHAPQLNVAIYIHGAEIYDGLAKKENDPLRKKKYVDSLMLIYDMRARNCGDAARVLNRKALAYFRYEINGPEPDRVLALMDTAFVLNGNSIMDVTLVPYMEATAVTRIKTKKISDEDVLLRYDRVSSILNFKIKKGDKNQGKLLSYKAQIDELLLKAVRVDCEFVHGRLGRKFKESPDDVVLAKRILGYLLAARCQADGLWIRAAELIFANERDFGLAKNLGLQLYAIDSLGQAARYFQEALRLAPNGADSADVYTYLGSLASKIGDRVEARGYFREAIKIYPQGKAAFDKIGDLYYNSFKQCAKELSMADDRMVYLIAYDYYNKASNSEKMQMAKKSFPSREEIFLMNYHAGQKVHVGCWIDEDTTVRTRD